MLSGIRELDLTQRLVEGEVTKITECTIVSANILMTFLRLRHQTR
jgi:hypothetical protein